MRINCILTVFISLMLFSIGAQTKNIGLTEEGKNILFDELRPKIRSWDQLNELMLQVIDDTKINKVIDCSFIHKNSSPTKNSNQHILYRDYSWNIYESGHGSTCIELTRPNVGFLNEDQSKVLLLASKGVGFEKLGLWVEATKYNAYIRSMNDTSNAYKISNYDELPLEKNETEIETDTNLLKTLKNQIVSPLTYFIYQIYENRKKCNGEFKTVCMEAIEYDKDNRTITFNYLDEYRVINANSNVNKLAVKSIIDIVKELGIDDKNNGMLQSILEDYEIPITIEKNNLFLDNKPICIKISMYIGYIGNNSNLLSYYGLRECNGEIKLTKKVKIYAL